MNPFEAFEKSASAAGLSTDQIETLKKEALASVNPEQKEKVAAEQSYANYQDGFTKAAVDAGVSANETAELFKMATSVTVDTLPTALKTYFKGAQEKTASAKTVRATPSINYVIGFAKTAQAYGLTGEQTYALLEKQGLEMADIEKFIHDHPDLTGGVAGAAGGAGLGAMMGGEGNRGKGALMGAGLGAGIGAGGVHAYNEGGNIKQHDMQELEGKQHALSGIFNSDQATQNGVNNQRIGDTMNQSNIGAYLRSVLGQKPYAQ